jgi:hypothetical protein
VVEVTKTADADTAIWDKRKVEITISRDEYQRYNILQKHVVDGGWLAADSE